MWKNYVHSQARISTTYGRRELYSSECYILLQCYNVTMLNCCNVTLYVFQNNATIAFSSQVYYFIHFELFDF